MTDCADYSKDYAACYDFITAHKCYLSESNSLVKYLEGFDIDGKILSVGCGKGLHEHYLAKRGFKVFGIDKSEWMIKHALKKSRSASNLSFGLTFDHAEQYLGSPFRCVISLFNVVNCLPDLPSLRDFFRDIFARMDKGGVFIFEAWNGMECVINPPKDVSREFNDSERGHLHRKASPKLNKLSQRLQIEYEIFGSLDGRPVNLKSVHHIRLFTVNEILYLLSCVGFERVHIFSSLPSLEPYSIDSSDSPRMLAFTVVK